MTTGYSSFRLEPILEAMVGMGITAKKPYLDQDRWSTQPSGVAHTTSPNSKIGGGGLPKWCGPHHLTQTPRSLGGPAKVVWPTPPHPNSEIVGGACQSGVAHTTSAKFQDLWNAQPRSDNDGGTQVVGLSRIYPYIDTSTNPLPSDYGFIAASKAAQLQHGHVNPLSKE